jgi:hypothetical protein
VDGPKSCRRSLVSPPPVYNKAPHARTHVIGPDTTQHICQNFAADDTMSNTCIIGLSPYISRRGWSWLTGLNGLPRQEFDWLENIVHFGYDSSSSLHRCVIIRPTSIATGEIRSKGDTQKGGTSRKLIYQTVRVSRQESNLRVAGSTKWCTNKTPPVQDEFFFLLSRCHSDLFHYDEMTLNSRLNALSESPAQPLV